MSLYNPATVNVQELDILRAPYLGGEFAVYLSHTAAKHIGSIEMTAEATGSYTDDAATTLTAVTGDDIQVVCTTPLLSDASCVITLATLDNTGTPVAMNGVATFAPPAWVSDQTFNFPRGYATDLVPAVNGKKYTSITSLTSITNGSKNSKFDFYVLPALTDYVLVGCTMDIDFNFKSRKALGIDCGMETDAFVKRGKTTPGDLSMSSKLKGIAAGMARFAGSKVTAMLVGLKDGQVIGDRIVFTGYVPGTTINAPEGEGEAVERVEGKFEEVLCFPAPYTP